MTRNRTTRICREDSDDSNRSDDASEAEEVPKSRKPPLQQTPREDEDTQIQAPVSSDEEGDDEVTASDTSSESISDPDIAIEDPDEEDDISDTSSTTSSQHLSGRAQLKKLQKNDLSQVAAGLSSADDIKQGRAVKQQQMAYDRPSRYSNQASEGADCFERPRCREHQ